MWEARGVSEHSPVTVYLLSTLASLGSVDPNSLWCCRDFTSHSHAWAGLWLTQGEPPLSAALLSGF